MFEWFDISEIEGKGKKRKVKVKFLLFDILNKIHNGYLTTDIYKKYGMRKQNFYYYIRKLKNLGLIELEYRTLGGAKYRLTPKGKNFYEGFVSSLKGYIRLHHVIFTYPIKKFGNLRFQRDWYANGTHFFYLKWSKHVGLRWNHVSMDVMISSLWGKSPFELLDEAKNLANEVISELTKVHGFEFGEGKLTRKPHFAIINQQTLNLANKIFKKLGMETTTEVSKVDGSEGFAEYEIVSDKNDEDPEDLAKYAEIAQNFPKYIYDMQKDISELKQTITNQLVPAISELSRQIQLHLEATQEWKTSATEIKNSISELTTVLKKLVEKLGG
ncbi:MAG: hypothetical protein DRO01_00105 [Thermoproteota archaeon]|nr:MAG: hypothetical protein DRO01_00105 [Candidatus Korarchaeota archaeon]